MEAGALSFILKAPFSNAREKKPTRGNRAEFTGGWQPTQGQVALPLSRGAQGVAAKLASGTVFLLPYYMGLYHGFIQESK